MTGVWFTPEGREPIDLTSYIVPTAITLTGAQAEWTPDEPPRRIFGLPEASLSMTYRPKRGQWPTWKRLVLGKSKWVPFDRRHHSSPRWPVMVSPGRRCGHIVCSCAVPRYARMHAAYRRRNR